MSLNHPLQNPENVPASNTAWLMLDFNVLKYKYGEQCVSSSALNRLYLSCYPQHELIGITDCPTTANNSSLILDHPNECFLCLDLQEPTKECVNYNSIMTRRS